MAGLTIAPEVIIFFAARPIATLCFGHAALGAVPVMRWIAPLPLVIAISNVIGILTMVTFGLDRQFSRILILAGAVNIVLGVPLILWLGAQGAGISVLVTETLVTLTMILVLLRHKIRIPLAWKVIA
jgi:O-antigen/teichoic acid export membrane protein